MGNVDYKDVLSLNITKLPKYLKSLKEVALNSLIDQLNMQSYVDDVVETRFLLWGYLLIGMGFIALVAMALYIVCKFNYAKKLLAMINGSKLSVNSPAGGRVTFSNTLGETDVMQTPTAPLLMIASSNDATLQQQDEHIPAEKDASLYPKLLSYKSA